MAEKAANSRYRPGCYACDISRGKRKPDAGGDVLKLQGNWTLSHYADTDTFLGRMGLQPYEHRDSWEKFTKRELEALGPNLRAITKSLQQYWKRSFPDDPIERIYIICFSEGDPESPHLHFHLIPRTKKMARILKYKCSVIAWDIYKINGRIYFPKKYIVEPKRNNKRVERLMAYVAKKIPGARVIKVQNKTLDTDHEKKVKGCKD